MWMCFCGPTLVQLAVRKTLPLACLGSQMVAYLLRCKQPGRSPVSHSPQVYPRKLSDWYITKTLEDKSFPVKILGSLREKGQG